MRRLFALLLAMSMILSTAPFGAFATEEETAPVTEAITEAETTEETAPAVVDEVTAGTEAPVMLADGDISSGTPDGTPPVLTGMTLSVTTVTAPGEIEVTVSATDDVSGVSSAHVYFYCEETERSLHTGLSKTYWDNSAFENVPYADGNFHGTIKVDQYLEAGTFVLRSIDVSDVAGNSRSYYTSYNPEWGDPEDSNIPDFVTQREIIVADSEVPDGTPPVLTGMILETTDITAPGEIEVIVSATDDVSGVSSAHVYFYCEETERSLHTGLSKTYWDNSAFENVRKLQVQVGHPHE